MVVLVEIRTCFDAYVYFSQNPASKSLPIGIGNGGREQMREILFRGKRRDNAEWVYGSFYPGIDEHRKRVFCIRTDNSCPDCPIIIPETRGQYTGLDDKNGKKIFEGDILKLTVFDTFPRDLKDALEKNNACLVEFFLGTFTILMKENHYFMRTLYHEVIGNIHDNPELLEEAE
jgi:uncharacterized phage protein (TIGR01671 family)